MCVCMGVYVYVCVTASSASISLFSPFNCFPLLLLFFSQTLFCLSSVSKCTSFSLTALFYLPFSSPPLIFLKHRQLYTLNINQPYLLYLSPRFLQSISSAEVRDCGYGEETCESHHSGDRRRRKRRGHDSDGACRSGNQRQRGNAGHQLFWLLYSTGGLQTVLWVRTHSLRCMVTVLQICYRL